MMKIIKKVIITIAILVVGIIIFICVYIKIRVDMDLKMYEKELEQSEKIDIPINRPIFEEYIKDKYGVLNESFNNVEYIGVHTGGRVRGTTGGHEWIRAYRITCDFIEKPFEVWVDNRTHEVFGDNFYDTLSTDSKFQHLYSDYIKEQIGLEDEDVELKYYGNNINIDFSNIKDMENIVGNIVENMSGDILYEIQIKNVAEMNNNNFIVVAYKKREQILTLFKRKFPNKIENEINMSLYQYGFKDDDERLSKVGTKDNINNAYFYMNINNANKDKYRYSYKDGNSIQSSGLKNCADFYGFKDVEVYYMGSNNDQGYEDGYICKGYSDTHKGAIAIGHKNVEYHGISKEVIGIVCRGTAEDDDWDTDFDIGDLKLRDNIVDNVNEGNTKDRTYQNIENYLTSNNVLDYNKKYGSELSHFAKGYIDWSHEYHHAGFDIVANRELEVLNEYIVKYDSDIDDNKCYWITGHSMGAAVANLIAAHLIKERQDNVYCYTFAAPNNFYLTDNVEPSTLGDETIYYEIEAPKASKYRCIFNIVNSDDFVPRLPMEECNWTKYGQVAEQSINNMISVKYSSKSIIHNYIKSHSIDYLPVAETNYEKFILDIYKNHGCIEQVNQIDDELYNVFGNHKPHMRENVYYDSGDMIVCDEDSIISNFINLIIQYNKYALPYQKMSGNVFDKYQTQKPAYFFNVIAGAMHENNLDDKKRVFTIFNQAQLVTTKLATRYIKARNAIVNNRDYIQVPHYLESYYMLTKEISTNDFR